MNSSQQDAHWFSRDDGLLPTEALPFKLHKRDALELLRSLPAKRIDLTLTSPPYYRARDYGVEGQLGWEKSPAAYLAKISDILTELLRVTCDTGSCFFVVGDSCHEGSLILVPQRIAVRASGVGWTVRNDLIWAKADAPPGRATDRWRYTHEHVLFLTKKARGYYFDDNAIRIPYALSTIKRWGSGQKYGGPKAKAQKSTRSHGFAKGKSFVLHQEGTLPPDVLRVPTARTRLMHYATFPEELIRPMIEAATRVGGIVLDPFAGVGTTGAATLRLGRLFLGGDINAAYLEAARLSCISAMENDNENESSRS